MITAPLIPRRISLLSTRCLLDQPISSGSLRSYANRSKPPPARLHRNEKSNPHITRRLQLHPTKGDQENRPYTNRKAGEKKGEARPLIEQLFPEETKRYEEAQRQRQREIPRLPLDATSLGPPPERNVELKTAKREDVPFIQQQMEQEMQEIGPQLTLLVLRNASPNLVEEDFRRLIPQGQHVEGWTLERGDILQVIPGRNLATLEQESYYYLLFSSQLSAFTYQGQATRTSRLAASHTPKNIMSAVAPTPGHSIDGVDAHAAIDSFALTPAGQTLELRQLKPPLSPVLNSIIRHRGYPSLVNRPDRLPYELRLTLEGPQLQVPALNHIFVKSAGARSFPWSGGVEQAPRITKWNPKAAAALARSIQNNVNDPFLATTAPTSTSADETELAKLVQDTERLERRLKSNGAEEDSDGRQRGRPPQNVFILGFHTEVAAQAFRRFWHRRQMMWKGVDVRHGDNEEDMPPIANIETLW